jgi:5-methylcytosine-specific restriction endonuclease McrA
MYCGQEATQVDHIIPYEQGFDLGIPASLLGGKNNIQFLKGEDNRAKWNHYQPMSVVIAITGVINGLQ